MFFANNSNIIIGAIMAAILIFALVSVIRSVKGGSACGCVTGRSCDGDCQRCDCTDCAGAGGKRKR